MTEETPSLRTTECTMEKLAFGQVAENAGTRVFGAAIAPVGSMESAEQSGVFASKRVDSSPTLMCLGNYHPGRTRLVQFHAELRVRAPASPA